MVESMQCSISKKMKKFRCRIFFLLIIVARALWNGEIPVADIGNAVCFIIFYVLVNRRPDRFRLLTWLGLGALIFNMFDGFSLYSTDLLVPAYLLWPLLVLYGVFLGDIWLALAAIFAIFSLFSYSIFRHVPLDQSF